MATHALINALAITQQRASASPESAANARAVVNRYKTEAGEYLRIARLRAGLTQEELGKLTGVGFTRVSHFERGMAHLAPANYIAVAKALDLDPKEMAMRMLRWTNPWVYSMLYGADRELRRDLKTLAATDADMVSAE